MMSVRQSHNASPSSSSNSAAVEMFVGLGRHIKDTGRAPEGITLSSKVILHGNAHNQNVKTLLIKKKRLRLNPFLVIILASGKLFITALNHWQMQTGITRDHTMAAPSSLSHPGGVSYTTCVSREELESALCFVSCK